LGGIDVPFEFSLDGHSDADVLLHAITDAILGAAAMGDIGELFPDTDQENHQRDSADMLLKAMQKVAESGFQIINLDCIVFAEKPKLSTFKQAIADRRCQSKNGRRCWRRWRRASDDGPVRCPDAADSLMIVAFRSAKERYFYSFDFSMKRQSDGNHDSLSRNDRRSYAR